MDGCCCFFSAVGRGGEGKGDIVGWVCKCGRAGMHLDSPSIHRQIKISTCIRSNDPLPMQYVRTLAVLVGEQPPHELGAVAALEVVLVLLVHFE